jgi:hypothetical protein
MNKRGWVALPIILLCFWFAIFLFYSNLQTQSPGGEANYLGEHAMNIYDTYYLAELDSFYYETAANLATRKSTSTNFESDFKKYFSEYISKKDLTIDDFDISISGTGNEAKILLKSKEKINYKNGPFSYSVPYSFGVTGTVSGQDSDKEITATLA